MKEKIEQTLNQVRPYLVADGGNVELVEVNDGVVKVKLLGACGGCPMATLTLKNFIEREIKKQTPEVREVVAV